MAEHADEVETFVGITSTTPEEAAFYLESANWSVADAVDAFYAAEPEIIEKPYPEQDIPPASAPANPPPGPSAGASSSRQASKKTTKPAQGKVRGLADLNKQDDDSDEDDANEYYAGGEKSGQVVKGGDGKKMDVESYFDKLRPQAREEDQNPATFHAPGQTPAAFSGRGRTLADAGEESKPASNNPTANSGAQSQAHTITFWANNVFTVDDGEPRSLTDPANRPFLESIGRGECPAELRASGTETEVKVMLMRKAEDYTAPEKPKYQAFSGTGRTLAGGDAPFSSATQPASSQQAQTFTTSWGGVDDSQPVTSIQIRMADGSRMVAKFNHNQTIGDIRRFIQASRPGQATNYQLLTAFPSAQLTDTDKSIADSGLLNAVIIQKL